jgi:hypothetical protein
MRDVNELTSLDDFIKQEEIVLDRSAILRRLSEVGQEMIEHAKKNGTFDEEML